MSRRGVDSTRFVAPLSFPKQCANTKGFVRQGCRRVRLSRAVARMLFLERWSHFGWKMHSYHSAGGVPDFWGTSQIACFRLRGCWCPIALSPGAHFGHRPVWLGPVLPPRRRARRRRHPRNCRFWTSGTRFWCFWRKSGALLAPEFLYKHSMPRGHQLCWPASRFLLYKGVRGGRLELQGHQRRSVVTREALRAPNMWSIPSWGRYHFDDERQMEKAVRSWSLSPGRGTAVQQLFICFRSFLRCFKMQRAKHLEVVWSARSCN